MNQSSYDILRLSLFTCTQYSWKYLVNSFSKKKSINSSMLRYHYVINIRNRKDFIHIYTIRECMLVCFQITLYVKKKKRKKTLAMKQGGRGDRNWFLFYNYFNYFEFIQLIQRLVHSRKIKLIHSHQRLLVPIFLNYQTDLLVRNRIDQTWKVIDENGHLNSPWWHVFFFLFKKLGFH